METQPPPSSIEPSAGAGSIPTSSAQGPKELSPGMASLFRGAPVPEKADQTNDSEPAPGPMAAPQSLLRKTWVRLSLFGADLLLLALAVHLVLRAHGRVGWLEIALCIVAVGMGAWLSCLALWRD